MKPPKPPGLLGKTMCRLLGKHAKERRLTKAERVAHCTGAVIDDAFISGLDRTRICRRCGNLRLTREHSKRGEGKA